MRFDIIKDEQSANRIREKLQRDFCDRRLPLRPVALSMPGLATPFPVLQAVSLNFDWGYRQKFRHVMYYRQTQNGYVKDLYPAAEHFLDGAGGLSERLFSLERTLARFRMAAGTIRAACDGAKKERSTPETQLHARVGYSLYEMKAEFAQFLFMARSVLDLVAALLQFLYGPSSNRFPSFTKFVKAVSKAGGENGKFEDDEMKAYVERRMAWYQLLCDFRDFHAHAGVLRVMPGESESGEIRFLVHWNYDLEQLVDQIHAGLLHFLAFCDRHFTKLIVSKLEPEPQGEQ